MGAIEVLVSLVAKSPVFAETVDGNTWYRLPETTRAYALEILSPSSEVKIGLARCAQRPFSAPAGGMAPRSIRKPAGAADRRQCAAA